MPKARSPRPLTHDALQAALRAQTRDLVEHMNRRFAVVDKRLGVLESGMDEMRGQLNTMDVKLDALMEYVPVTRKHLHNLVRALKAKGIELDEAEVFAT